MVYRVTKRSEKAGLPAGSLIHLGKQKTGEVKIVAITYDESRFEERVVDRLEEIGQLRRQGTLSWINIHGVHDVEVLRRFGEDFGLHPLTLEDILSTDQRPKIEAFENYVFVVLKMLYCEDDSRDWDVTTEQISLVLGDGFVISFQETDRDIFGPIKERIQTGKGRVRKMGADYLAYSLLDFVVDSYFTVLEQLDERLEFLEEEVVTSPSPKTLQAIHSLKSEMVFLRKSVWPLREVISRLERGESAFITENTGIYLRDVYDHTIQVIDTVETFRDIVSGLLDIYLSSISNRTNAIMKVLTIIATIFMPLTFIAGVYGMNFQHMPELASVWGYPAVLALMAAVALIMIVFFRRRHWL
ncbi:MAG: magnesium/cobalt transporter CorA [Pseudomonadota bacterium]